MGEGVKSTSDKLHYYAYSTINAPDKGEVGGSSPPRPTVNFTFGRMALHSGVENAALSCRRTCKAVQDTARLWKKREVIFSQFAGRSSVGENACLSCRTSRVRVSSPRHFSARRFDSCNMARPVHRRTNS